MGTSCDLYVQVWGRVKDEVERIERSNQSRAKAQEMEQNQVTNISINNGSDIEEEEGVTHSSCEILDSYGVRSPFMGPTGNQICYNGHFQHSYLLNYTLDTLKAIGSDPHALPLFAYMSLNVGHDHIGRRIQTLDNALVQYINELSLSEDTITIMLADHGNTYTRYTITIAEGRFEMFHPHLFIIIPNKVANRLGKEALNALTINQHRLVNVIDLHHSIMALLDPLTGRVSPRGLFTPISANRTCNDMELRMPNLCVCEGWDTPATNDSFKIAFVEFAVGQLNNLLEEQFQKSLQQNRSSIIQRSCVRLYAVRFGSVRERQDSARGSLVTSMDIYVPAGNVVSQKEDVFHVEIESHQFPGKPSLNMRLLHFDRMTMYGKYGVCADQGVSLKLCVCSSPQGPTSPHPTHFLGRKPTVTKIDKCVFLLTRQHVERDRASPRPLVFAYELVNICLDKRLIVSVEAKLYNIKLSRNVPFKVGVPPGSTTFVLSAKKDYEHWKSSIDVTVKTHTDVKERL
ncbi:hypothetical protein QZH41_006521 [Actinostola sp. cb2023]|nr:hypothetical protein QZH41_006521 [Actinostola sp. cb2023]